MKCEQRSSRLHCAACAEPACHGVSCTARVCNPRSCQLTHEAAAPLSIHAQLLAWHG